VSSVNQQARKLDGRTTRHAHRRGEIVAAAADYVTQHGLNLPLRSLASGIGISHATLVHHFGSKDALIAEVLSELRARHRLLIVAESERSGDAPPGALLERGWQRLTTPSYRPYWRLFFHIYGLALVEPEQFERFLGGVVSDWLEVMEETLERYGMEEERARPLATLVLGAFRGVLLDWLVTGDRARGRRAIASLAEHVNRSLEHDQLESSLG
jgi:AcrR family transcriptional regulator